MNKLIDFSLLILATLGIILFYAVGYYVGLAVIFWSWDYNSWIGTVVDVGFLIRLLLILFCYVTI
jgi:hypothetical protein